MGSAYNGSAKIFKLFVGPLFSIDEDALLQKVLKMKLSSGKLQFWEWEKTLLVPEHFVPLPYWYFTFLHAGNVFRHGGM